jgi:hypothetical protein
VPCSEKSFAFSFLLCDGVAGPDLSTDSGAVEEVAIEITVLWSGTGWKKRARSSVARPIAGDFSTGSEGAGKVMKGGFKGSCRRK